MAARSEPLKLSEKERAALYTIVQGTNKFAIKLYTELASKQTGNVFVSPLSVQLVLALAYTGAKGDTAAELARLLSMPKEITDTFTGYNSLIKVLQDPALNLANRMFVEATAGVKEEFQKNAEKYFNSLAEPVDFRKDGDKSRLHINSWVEDQTNKKIKDFLEPGVISPLTRMILVNAVYFKANWQQKFQKEATKEQPFYISKTKTVPVMMMNAKKKFSFMHDRGLKSKILLLDYEGDNLSMVVFLPDEIDGLAELEAKLETVNIAHKLMCMKEFDVTVAFPKFKLEETLDLNNILQYLGAPTMFSDSKADFSGLSDERLVVSEVVQTAVLEVNEEGTEAAAITRARMMYLCGVSYSHPPEFIADHPFIFTIMSNEVVLFVGRFTEPIQN